VLKVHYDIFERNNITKRFIFNVIFHRKFVNDYANGNGFFSR